MLLEDEYYCIGDENEVREYKRKLYFSENDLEIKGKYNVLVPSYQDIVNKVLFELRDGDFFGFNLKRFLEGHKDANRKCTQLYISTVLANNEELVSQLTLKNGEVTISEFAINKQLDAAKTRWKLSESEDKVLNKEYFVWAICDNFLVEDDLLKNGIGRISLIKDEWYDKFMWDIENSSFSKVLKSDAGHNWSTSICITKYEEYLRKEGKLEKKASILEEKWAVMTYSGAYHHLNTDKNRQNEKRAIDRLINELYVRQLLDGKMPTIENHL